MTLWLLGIGIVVSLTKGFDYEEAIVLALAAGLLWIGRKEFYRPASLLDEPFSFKWMLSISLVVSGAIWLGFFVHRHVEYSNDLWWTFAANSDAPRMLRAGLTTVILLATFGVWRLMRPPLPAGTPPTADDLALARKVLQTAHRAEANVVLSADKSLLFDEHGDAFIMYQFSGRSGIALGDPVGNPARHESLVWRFRELCDQVDVRCAFYQVTPARLPLYVDLGLTLSKLGEEARVPLADFSLEGSKYAELRQARNRAHREGALFEIVVATSVPPLLPEMRAVSDAWLAGKSASEKGFSLGAFDEQYLSNFDVALVRIGGSIIAFANLWKAGDGSEFSIDLMRHLDSAPKGIMDYLFAELMLWGKDREFPYFNMGMAPLSGLERHALAPLWHKIGNLIFRLGDEFYNFDGLRRYKEKFHPEWEPRYLAAPGGTELPRVLVDATTLISGGVKDVFAR
jgi:phosphatidylglycerol lysyltransferase